MNLKEKIVYELSNKERIMEFTRLVDEYDQHGDSDVLIEMQKILPNVIWDYENVLIYILNELDATNRTPPSDSKS